MGGCVSAPKEKKTPVDDGRTKTTRKSTVASDIEHDKIKIVLVGEGDAGKSTLCKTWAYGPNPSTTVTTDPDYYEKTFVSEEGHSAVVNLWDTGGQERFRSITNSYYRSAEAILLVFDQNYEHGRSTIIRWIEEALRYADNDVVVAVIANKKDVAEAELSLEEVNKYIHAHGLNYGFFNISALTGDGVDDVLNATCERVIKVREKSSDCDLPWGAIQTS